MVSLNWPLPYIKNIKFFYVPGGLVGGGTAKSELVVVSAVPHSIAAIIVSKIVVIILFLLWVLQINFSGLCEPQQQ